MHIYLSIYQSIYLFIYTEVVGDGVREEGADTEYNDNPEGPTQRC